MDRRGRSVRIAGLLTLLAVLPLMLVRLAAGAEAPLHFPRPGLLVPNVEFWKQVYTEYGIGDFVLHDRENLGVVYQVVRVNERADQGRAAALATPEVQRARARYEGILTELARGARAEDLGPEAVRVTQLWECPCAPEFLKKAAGNIRVQQGLREKVGEGLRRAKPLLPKIVTILREHDVPLELAALPMVESTFNPHAQSKAGAVGLWQFIKSTGKKYLRIGRKRDDRRDPIRATTAAARLLRSNYDTLGSWPLAIVAYNHGTAGIQNASGVVGSRAIEDIIARYSGPRFGFASRNFYPEFLAALEVVQPHLLAHARPLEAKSLQRSVQRVALPARPVPAPATAVQPVALPVPATPAPVELPPAGAPPVPVEPAAVAPATPAEAPVGAPDAPAEATQPPSETMPAAPAEATAPAQAAPAVEAPAPTAPETTETTSPAPAPSPQGRCVEGSDCPPDVPSRT